jgi:hypothetical protein
MRAKRTAGSINLPLNAAVAFLILASASLVEAQTIQTLYSFNGIDGAYPEAALTLGTDGYFYGTTYYGGTNGGGTSTGGVYAVTGAIGQPDTGTLSGGNYTLEGGFWGIVAAVQTPRAPWLSVIRTATNSVVVSWPSPADGWALKCASVLTGGLGVWTQIPPPYQTNATSLYFTEPQPAGSWFYRLHKP